MVFHYPKIALFFIAFGIMIFIYLWARWQRKRELLRLGEWRLVQGLIPILALIRRKQKDVLALVALLILIFAAMGPQYGSKLKEVKQRGVDVFIALDTSRSMLAEDVNPSRIEKAKRSLGLLVRRLNGNRVGIIAFAGFAVIQCPLTVDSDAAKIFLDVLDTQTVPKQGTAMGDAVRLALEAFPETDKGDRAIVLLTDGEDHRSDPIEAANMAKEKGVKIFTIGIGTSKGEVLKNRDAQGRVVEFHKYKGEMVLSRLDDGLLTKMATITGGKYFQSSSTDKEIDQIADILTGLEKSEYGSKTYERYKERYQIFAFIALILLIFEFFFAEKPQQWKRFQSNIKKMFSLIILIIFFCPHLSHANMKQQVMKGNKLLKQKDFSGARSEFESALIDEPDAAFLPYNIAATHFMEGNLEEAKRQYERAALMTNDPVLKSNIAYNLGYISFLEGNREAAINKLKECLKINPKDEDAKYNIEYILAGHSPPPPPQNEKQKGERNDPNENKEQQSGEDQKEGESQGEQQKEQSKSELNKEDAERILQMIQDEESEKLQNQKPLPLGSTEKEKEKGIYEDW